VLTHGAQRRRETIGRVGVLGLQEARSEAKRLLAEYTLGKAAPSSVTWHEAADEYLAEIKRTRKARTHASYTYVLAKHFRFGDTRLSKLGPADFVRRLNKLTDRPSEHRHAYAVLRSFVGWAYRKHYFEDYPLARMKAPAPPRSRDRVLTPAELRAVFRNTIEGNKPFDKIVALLILTGQRRTQIGALHDSWLAELGYINIPKDLTKHTAHRFPIGPLTQEVLGKNRTKSSYLFPATRERRKGQPAALFNGWGNAKAAFDKKLAEAGHVLGHWTLHDLRRTFRTNWAALGIRREVAEKYIHHISGVHSGVNGIYDQHDYLEEMKLAAVRWERYLAKILRD
jgi:integrase